MKAIQTKRLVESILLILHALEDTPYPEIDNILSRMHRDGEDTIKRLDIILERRRWAQEESNED